MAPGLAPEDSPKCADFSFGPTSADKCAPCADFTFNPKGADLSFCVCCNVSLKADPNHAFSEMHLSCMGRVLTDPLFCDCVLRDVRPKKAETELVVSCESALKYFLKPRELLLIGSKGK